MKAIVLTKFGGPECLELRDVDLPAPGPGELRVRVHAAGTNPVDAKIRAAGSWANVQPPQVIGYDASGTVEAVGVGVAGFSSGDEVYFTPEILGNRHGTYAELTLVPASIVAPKPRGLSHIEAAAVPLAGGTAYEAIIRRLRVLPGETVLIHGASGGVGSFAVQLAKVSGARVIATASPHNHALLRELGADVCVDYHSQDVAAVALAETAQQGVDAVFDCVGGSIEKSIPATRAFGRLATILAPRGDFSGLYSRNLTLHGVFLTRERERLLALGRLLERKQLRPVVTEVLPLERAAAAHARLDTGHGAGKIVLRVS